VNDTVGLHVSLNAMIGWYSNLHFDGSLFGPGVSSNDQSSAYLSIDGGRNETVGLQVSTVFIYGWNSNLQFAGS
jgi:hypothetical protein